MITMTSQSLSKIGRVGGALGAVFVTYLAIQSLGGLRNYIDILLLFVPALLIAARLGGAVSAGIATMASLAVLPWVSASGDPPSILMVNLGLFALIGGMVSWTGAELHAANAREVDANEHLLNRTAELDALLETALDAVVVIEGNGVVRGFNRAAEKQFGYRAQEILGMNVSMLMPEPYRSQHDSYLANYIRTGEKRIIGTDRVVVGLRKDGTTFPMKLAVGELAWHGNMAFVGFVRDLSAVEETALELQSSHNEIARLARYNELGEMASTLAHELNQPLTAASNFIQGAKRIAASGVEPKQLEEVLSEASRQILRAGNIIRHLREFVTRGDTEMRASDLNKIVEEACALALLGSRQRNIRTFMKLGQVPPILANRVQVQQVLVNLIRNAEEAMRDTAQKTLVVLTGVKGTFAFVDITDTGSGIPADVAQHLFEPFVSGRPGGMGIGLSIAKRIMAAHSGSISVQKSDHTGTTFRLELPLLEERPAHVQ
jgi:two-component system sensor kinase FixL